MTAKKKNPDAIWQVVQERIGLSGAVIERRKIGAPRTIESARQIVEYKNVTELRDYVKYRVEKVEDDAGAR